MTDHDHMQRALGFAIEDRSSVRVLAHQNGACRPATKPECVLWDALTAALRSQSAQAVPEGWRQLAANWLERRAVEQEATNAQYPRHAAAYKEWRDRPAILRMLAQAVVSAADPVIDVKRNCQPPSWMFPEDECAAAPKPEGR